MHEENEIKYKTRLQPYYKSLLDIGDENYMAGYVHLFGIHNGGCSPS